MMVNVMKRRTVPPIGEVQDEPAHLYAVIALQAVSVAGELYQNPFALQVNGRSEYYPKAVSPLPRNCHTSRLVS